jgi:hypothetical protein
MARSPAITHMVAILLLLNQKFCTVLLFRHLPSMKLQVIQYIAFQSLVSLITDVDHREIENTQCY